MMRNIFQVEKDTKKMTTKKMKTMMTILCLIRWTIHQARQKHGKVISKTHWTSILVEHYQLYQDKIDLESVEDLNVLKTPFLPHYRIICTDILSVPIISFVLFLLHFSSLAYTSVVQIFWHKEHALIISHILYSETIRKYLILE